MSFDKKIPFNEMLDIISKKEVSYSLVHSLFLKIAYCLLREKKNGVFMKLKSLLGMENILKTFLLL